MASSISVPALMTRPPVPVSHLMTSLGRNTTTSSSIPEQKLVKNVYEWWSWQIQILFSSRGWLNFELETHWYLYISLLSFVMMVLVGVMNEVKRENLVNIPVTCLCRLTGPGNMDLWLLQVRMITIGLSKKNIFTIQSMAAEARKTINCRSHSIENFFTWLKIINFLEWKWKVEEEKVKHSMVDICVITGGGCRWRRMLPEREGAEKVIECVLFVLMPRPGE